jgi:hypothetical protein
MRKRNKQYLGCKQNLEEPVNDRFGCLFARKSVGLRQALLATFEMQSPSNPRCDRPITIHFSE